MSIFETPQNDQEGVQDELPLFETLVGEGKKFKTAEDLAKAKLESDRFIDQLKEEPKQLREELDRALERAALLERIANGAPPAQAQGNQSEEEPPANDKFDLDARIKESLEKLNLEGKRSQNLQEVSDHMVSLFGTEEKVREVIVAKARELGVGVDFLQSAAAQSPKAFFKTIGVDEAPRSQKTSMGSNVNTAGMSVNSGNTKQGTYAWYKQLRLDNPKEYHSTRIQNQMMKEALAKGEAFYQT